MNDNLNKYLNLSERARKTSRNPQTYSTDLQITFIRKKQKKTKNMWLKAY